VAEASDDVAKRVIKLVAERMDKEEDQISGETHFVNDLQADSLDMAELVIDLEDEFEMDISDEEAQKIETVGQAIEHISGHLK